MLCIFIVFWVTFHNFYTQEKSSCVERQPFILGVGLFFTVFFFLVRFQLSIGRCFSIFTKICGGENFLTEKIVKKKKKDFIAVIMLVFFINNF